MTEQAYSPNTEITVRLLKYGPPYTEVDFCEIMLLSHAPAFSK